MSVNIIAAITADNAIGVAGDMLYHIKDDLRRFRDLTMGHALIMGRKTFESLPGGALPGRRNLVVTRNPGYSAPGIETFPSLEAALDACAGTDAFIIGGGEIYSQTMPLAASLLITLIDTRRADDADTFFPAIDPEQWNLVQSSPSAVDPRSGASYSFLTFSRRK